MKAFIEFFPLCKHSPASALYTQNRIGQFSRSLGSQTGGKKGTIPRFPSQFVKPERINAYRKILKEKWESAYGNQDIMHKSMGISSSEIDFLLDLFRKYVYFHVEISFMPIFPTW